MPPRSHSSSHHSSSSHRSSHSSSHHSSRSHSSHSSSHRSGSSRSYSSSRSSYSSHTPVRRTRHSQPYGWKAATYGKVSSFHCTAHDYDYYPMSWMAEDGRQFEEGYYDENGQHYNNVVVEGGTTILKCNFCENRIVYTWENGSLPTCDKCGAQLQIDATDKAENVGINTTRLGNRRSESRGAASFIRKSIVFLCFMGMLGTALMIYSKFEQQRSLSGENAVRSENVKSSSVSAKNSIYVEEIGRTCYKDGADWYDSDTQCWFWYNNEQSPYQWQYWYEGISSDYDDYGWMEYDMDEQAWYVEVSDGSWVHLPDTYDTSKLWHMTDEYTNAYE